MISLNDAVLLLRKWHAESHALKFMFVGDGVSFAIEGTLRELAPEGLSFVPFMLSDFPAEILVDLRDCAFEYGDSREAKNVAALAAMKYASALTVIRPSGSRCVFFERRT